MPIPQIAVTEELALVAKVFEGDYVERIERKSPRAFDLTVQGTTMKLGGRQPVKYSAWLPLAAIRETNWPALAAMSDHPTMVREGDWSGIRDSKEETIWAMFAVAKRYLNR